jgi:hypothetical protein
MGAKLLDIRDKRLIYNYKWWDGWPPNSRVKRLFVRRKYFLIQFEGPKQGPKRYGFLGTSADVGFGDRARSTTFRGRGKHRHVSFPALWSVP